MVGDIRDLKADAISAGDQEAFVAVMGSGLLPWLHGGPQHFIMHVVRRLLFAKGLLRGLVWAALRRGLRFHNRCCRRSPCEPSAPYSPPCVLWKHDGMAFPGCSRGKWPGASVKGSKDRVAEVCKEVPRCAACADHRRVSRERMCASTFLQMYCAGLP